MTAPARGARYERNLARLLDPASVAVVGASERNFYGRTVLRNLRGQGFGGTVVAVNPRAAEVDGVPSVPSLRDGPPVDVVVIVTPAAAVPAVVADAAATGAAAVVILSTGFAETGEVEDAERERELLATAAAADMVVVGPNTIGMFGVASGLAAMGAPVPWPVQAGPVALVMQSGGLMTGCVAALSASGVGLAHVVSLGNGHGTDAADWLTALAARPEVQVIGLLLETLPDWPRLRAAMAAVRDHGKRAYAVKVGRSEQGKAAAATHTGALAGDHRVAADLLRQAGIREVRTLDGLLLALRLESAVGAPYGTNVVGVAASGGAVGLFADLAAAHGVRLGPLTGAVRDELAGAGLPGAQNPLDIGGQALNDPERMTRTVRALLSDDDTAVGVYLPSLGLPGPELPHHRDQMARVAEGAKAGGKPVIATQLAHSPGTPSALDRYAGSPELIVAPSLPAVLDGLAAWLRQPAAPAEPPPAASAVPLTEWDAKRALRAAGFDVPRADLVPAGGPAPEIPYYPVVAKGVSPGILHKSAAGLVRLGVGDAAELEEARRAFAATGHPLDHVLVEEMVGPGTDLFVSVTGQPYGTVLALGLGGTDVEERDAVRFLGVPFDPDDVRTALAELDRPGIDAGRLHAFLTDLAAYAAGHRLTTLELNPVRLRDGRFWLLDAVAIPA